MKILLDECTPHAVKKGLPARDIRTVQEMGWAGVKNANRSVNLLFTLPLAKSGRR